MRLLREPLTQLIVAAVMTLPLLSACTTNPVTGESQFSIISPAQEISIGSRQYLQSQQSQGGRYIVDPDLTFYVSSVGDRLGAVSDRDLPYEFVVLNNDIPNAWALPGGKIAINRGLLVYMEDEAQLAAVLAHEIVHAAARHGAIQMTQGTLLGVGTQVIGVSTHDHQYGALINQGAQMGGAAINARHSRKHELEADKYGMDYMVRAGYDPQAAVELQETFVKLSEGRDSNWLQGLFATHPPSQLRADTNRRYAQQLPSGVRNKAAYDRAMAQVRKDSEAYKKHAEAQKIADKDPKGALRLVDQAIKLQKNEPSFWVTKGMIQLNDSKASDARTSFSRAHSLYPEYFMPLLGRGLAEKSLRRYREARDDLQRSQQIMATQTASYHLGELELAAGNRQTAIGYFQAVQNAQGPMGESARNYLKRLLPPPQQPANSTSR